MRRVLPAILAPIVLLGRGCRTVMFGLFAAAERIDPLAWVASVLSRLHLLSRLQSFGQWIQHKSEPLVAAMRAVTVWLGGVLAGLTGWIGPKLATAADKIRPALEGVWHRTQQLASVLARICRPVWDLVVQAARRMRLTLGRLVGPVVQAVLHAATRLRLRAGHAADRLASVARLRD